MPSIQQTTIIKKPRVSIITCVHNSDEHIEGFLCDIVRQTIFDQCELIIINANSSGNEELIIQSYCQKYPNIRYEKLLVNPGLYGVLNYALKKTHANLITHAYVEDRRNPESLEKHAIALENDITVDVVYSNVYLAYVPNETFENNNCYWVMSPQEFAPERMYLCLPGPQPMWRASLHTRYGFFDEEFMYAGDFEFWNRIASKGSIFKKISFISGLFYQYQESEDHHEEMQHNKASIRAQENDRIAQKYGYLWRR